MAGALLARITAQLTRERAGTKSGSGSVWGSGSVGGSRVDTAERCIRGTDFAMAEPLKARTG